MTTKNDDEQQQATRKPASEYDDPRRPLVRALRLGSYGLLGVTLISLMAWGGFKGLPGIWGVLLGAAIGGGFMLATVISVLMTSSTSPTVTGAVVLGGWLVKLVVLLLVLMLIRDMTFYSSVALFVTMLLSLIVVLVTEAYGVITSRVTYLN